MLLDQVIHIDWVLGQVGPGWELFPPEKTGDLLALQESIGLLQPGSQLEVLSVEISQEGRVLGQTEVELVGVGDGAQQDVQDQPDTSSPARDIARLC